MGGDDRHASFQRCRINKGRKKFLLRAQYYYCDSLLGMSLDSFLSK